MLPEQNPTVMRLVYEGERPTVHRGASIQAAAQARLGARRGRGVDVAGDSVYDHARGASVPRVSVLDGEEASTGREEVEWKQQVIKIIS